MLHIVDYLKRIAAIILGATLTKEELKQMIDHLEKMLDKGYFVEKEDPLTLQPDYHFKTNFFGYNFSGLRTMTEIFDRIEDLIKTTGKVGDAGMQFLAKTLERSPEWKMEFKGMDYETAKHKARKALEFLGELIYKMPSKVDEKPTISPEEMQEMQRHKVINPEPPPGRGYSKPLYQKE